MAQRGRRNKEGNGGRGMGHAHCTTEGSRGGKTGREERPAREDGRGKGNGRGTGIAVLSVALIACRLHLCVMTHAHYVPLVIPGATAPKVEHSGWTRKGDGHQPPHPMGPLRL